MKMSKRNEEVTKFKLAFKQRCPLNELNYYTFHITNRLFQSLSNDSILIRPLNIVGLRMN